MNGLRYREEDAVRPVRSFRLDRANGKIMGVCSGIGRYFGINPNLIRVAFVVTALLGFGSPVLIYLAIGLIAD